MGCCSVAPNDIDKVEYNESSDECSYNVSEANVSIDEIYKPNRLRVSGMYKEDLRLRSISFYNNYKNSQVDRTATTNDMTQLSMMSKKGFGRSYEKSFGDDYAGCDHYETCQ